MQKKEKSFFLCSPPTPFYSLIFLIYELQKLLWKRYNNGNLYRPEAFPTDFSQFDHLPFSSINSSTSGALVNYTRRRLWIVRETTSLVPFLAIHMFSSTQAVILVGEINEKCIALESKTDRSLISSSEALTLGMRASNDSSISPIPHSSRTFEQVFQTHSIRSPTFSCDDLTMLISDFQDSIVYL